MGSVGRILAGYGAVLVLFFVAIVVGSYVTFAQHLFVPKLAPAVGMVLFALLGFVMPVATCGGFAALARRFIVRFHTGDVFSVFIAILFGQFVAMSLGLVFSEIAPTLLPLSARGVKLVGTLGTAMQGGVLLGALAGAKQVWAGRKEDV